MKKPSLMRLKTNLLLAVLAIAISCSDHNVTGDDTNDPGAMADDYRISRILNYPNSSASQPYGFVNFSYYDNGNLKKESMTDYPNTVTTYKTYEYTGGKLTTKKIYDGQVGNLTLGTYISYYYTNDKITKEELRLGDGTLWYTTHNEFS